MATKCNSLFFGQCCEHIDCGDVSSISSWCSGPKEHHNGEESFSVWHRSVAHNSQSHPLQSDTVIQITNHGDGSCWFSLFDMDWWNTNENAESELMNTDSFWDMLYANQNNWIHHKHFGEDLCGQNLCADEIICILSNCVESACHQTASRGKRSCL